MAMRFKCGVVVSFPERPDFRTDVMFISAIVFDSAGSEVCLYVHTPPAWYLLNTWVVFKGSIFYSASPPSYRKRHLWGAYEESMFSTGDYEPPAFYLSPHLNVKLGIGTRSRQIQRFAVHNIWEIERLFPLRFLYDQRFATILSFATLATRSREMGFRFLTTARRNLPMRCVGACAF